MSFIRRMAVLPCGGINPKTGKRVGSRHRWQLGWGVGTCTYCHRTLEEVTRFARVYPSGRIVQEKY